MHHELLTILLAFFEGFALILSPCILSILPLFLASSFTGSKKRPLGLICGFIVIFALFVFFSRALLQAFAIDFNLVRHIAYVILFVFGLILCSSRLSNLFSQMTQDIANLSLYLFSTQKKKGSFMGDFILGGLMALVWTPCAGPILAAVIVQTVIQKTTLFSFFTLVAFSLGVGIPMFLIAYYGRALLTHLNILKTKGLFFRKIMGLIILLSVGYMIYFEKGQSVSVKDNPQPTATSLQEGLWRPYAAPEIKGIETWLNSQPLSIEQLKGKVVLIDFWTYSCINCLRTLPYIKKWHEKYKDKGLVIIGVHSPEFYFEKNVSNVRDAVAKHGIEYPVALDNQFKTWTNFSNQYWPAHYLVDKRGRIVYKHFGEGKYGVTENNIAYLLGIHPKGENALLDKAGPLVSFITPETYLGFERASLRFSPTLIRDEPHNYQFPKKLAMNEWGLQGEWQAQKEKIVSTKPEAAIKIHFKARRVYVVMGSKNDKTIAVDIFLNGEQVVDEQGKDVRHSQIVVGRHRLYEAIAATQKINGILQIKSKAQGLEIYTFTFGD